MHPSATINPFDQLRESVEWAEHLLRQQPDDLRQEYEQAGLAVAQLFTVRRYSVTLQLPSRIQHDVMLMLHVPSSMTRLRAGGLINRFSRKPVEPGVIHRLQDFCQHVNPVASESARLVCYVAARQILTALPNQANLCDHYTAFDRERRLTASNGDQAMVMLDHLSQHMQRLFIAGQLYPGWTMHGLYNETATILTAHMIEQGHALADYFTQQLINDVRENWLAGKITRGLTLFLPYLDERRYQMREYKVVVIPTGRILFRPEFMIGACRLAQRQVRKDPDLSQSTRWQLLSQLDSILRAFEIDLSSPH